MLPEIWGKYGWTFLHMVTIDYPENPTNQDKIKYYNYIESLQYVLPCDKCKNNMSEHLKELPLTDNILSSRTNFIKWGIDLHNIVNKSLRKKEITYDQALDNINKIIKLNRKKEKNDMDSSLNSDSTDNSKDVFIACLMITILIMSYMLFKKK